LKQGVVGVVVREARSGEVGALGVLISDDLVGTPYAESARYFLRLAGHGRPDEARAFVAERDGEIVGFVLLGAVAGTIGTGRLLLLGVRSHTRRRGLGIELCAAASAYLEAHGARTIVVEMPEDPSTAICRTILDRCGFVEAARVLDYYRDGVPLVVFQRIKPIVT
jgi:ribosomal protein S18 acetylase RimI-like enzyme